jgi:hypothetical protein
MPHQPPPVPPAEQSHKGPNVRTSKRQEKAKSSIPENLKEQGQQQDR